MKTLITVLSASAIFSTLAFGEVAGSTTQNMEQDRIQSQNEVQNRFRTMSTDELLEKRGTMTQQQDRDHLHQELQNRYQTMTQDQKQKFDQRPPENRIQQGAGSGSGGKTGGGAKKGR